jgi:hypothetical protein
MQNVGTYLTDCMLAHPRRQQQYERSQNHRRTTYYVCKYWACCICTRTGLCIKYHTLCSGCSGFDLCILTEIFMVFLSPYVKVLVYCIRIGHDHFLY